MTGYSPIGPVQASREGGWELTLYSDLTGNEAPHRALLSRLEMLVPEMRLSLPNWSPDEDCVEGHIEWEAQQVQLYFEAMVLNFLSFGSGDRPTLENLRAFVLQAALSR